MFCNPIQCQVLLIDFIISLLCHNHLLHSYASLTLLICLQLPSAGSLVSVMVRQLGLHNITSGNTGWENNVFVEAALP